MASFIHVNAAFATNLIVNGDFETGDRSAWSFSGTVVTGNANSGLYALALNGNPTGYVGSRQTVSIIGGNIYRIEFWLAISGWTTGNYLSQVRFYNASGSEIKSARTNFGSEGSNINYIKQSADLTAPADAVSLRIELKANTADGTGYFDDVSIIDLSAGGPDLEAPTVPSGVAATAISDTQIDLSWNTASDLGGGNVAGYNIYRDGGGVAIATVSGTSYADTGLAPNTAYSYTVSAFDDANPANESAESTAAGATTLALPDTEAPTVPSGLSATAVSDTQIDLSWTASTDSGGGSVAGYNIYRDGGATPVAMVAGTSYSDTGLTASTAYTYTVSAVDTANPANESLQSSSDSATTLSAPVNVNLLINGDFETGDKSGWSSSGTVVTGNANSGLYALALNGNPTGYVGSRQTVSIIGGNIYRIEFWLAISGWTTGNYLSQVRFYNASGSEINSARTNFGSVGSNVNYIKQSADLTAPADAVSLRIELKANTADGTGYFDDVSIIDLSVSNGPDVLAPTVPSAVAAVAASDTQINLSWNASSDLGGGNVAGYNIYRDGGGVAIATVSGTSYADMGLAPNTAYSYTVSAFDDANPANESAESAAVGATTLSAPISLPITEDFSSGFSRWVVVDDYSSSSNWQVTGGILEQTLDPGLTLASASLDDTYHTGTYAYLSEAIALTDYSISVTLTPMAQAVYSIFDDGHDVGLMFRYQNNNNYYRIAFNSQYGYARLERKLAGVWTTLAADARGYMNEGVPIQLNIELRGDLIQVYVDGEARFAVQDSGISSGTVALYTEDNAQFDNIVLDVNSPSPSIVISEPQAYSAQTGTSVAVSAVALNLPVNYSVEFEVGGSSCSAAVEESPGYFTANCSGLLQGEHTFTADLKDNGISVANDSNTNVASSAEVRIVIGDSISNGVTDTVHEDNKSLDGKVVGEQGYVAILQNLLNVSRSAPQMIYNEAVPGDESWELDQRILSILERRPGANIAQIMIGTNDSGGVNTTPSGQGCSGAACDGTYKGYVQNLIDTLTNAGVTPIIAQIPPDIDTADPLNSPRNQIIQEYNSVLRSELSIPAAGPDFFSYFLSADENRISLMPDTLHFNGLGYVIMAHLWEHYLNGGTSLPSRSQLPLVLEDICVRISSASCQDPLQYKQDLMQAGNPYFIDSTESVLGIPDELDGGIWVMSANADSVNTRTDYLEFTIDRDVELYVAYDASATTPDWMATFVDTGLNVTVSDATASTLRLYRKTFIYGVDTSIEGTIQLGGNMAVGASGANSNYIVIVKAQ